MIQRGRKSAEGLTVVPFSPARAIFEPPADLSATEAEIFRSVVAGAPNNWFNSDSLPLLVEYSRAWDACNKLSAILNGGLEQIALAGGLKDLLGMREKQARLMVTLATKMRLTQQSKILPDKAGTLTARKAVSAAPWGDQSATQTG